MEQHVNYLTLYTLNLNTFIVSAVEPVNLVTLWPKMGVAEVPEDDSELANNHTRINGAVDALMMVSHIAKEEEVRPVIEKYIYSINP